MPTTPLPRAANAATSAATSVTRKKAFALCRIRYPAREDNLKCQLVPGGERRSKSLDGFETGESAKAELRRRIRSVQGMPRHMEARDVTATMLTVARDLLVGLTGRSADPAWASFANPVFMRRLRVRLIGEILRNVRQVGAPTARIYHLASPSWRIRPDDLETFSPRRLRESVRTELIRTGKLDKLSGWLICFFHCSFDRRTGLLEPHFHLLVVGEKYLAVEALRELDLFAGGESHAIRRPIVSQPIGNPARQIAYLLKGYWQAIDSYIDSRTGKA